MHAPILVAVSLALLALVVYALMLYNALTRLRNDVDRTWANVDVVLKQRADEVPNLASAVRGYAAHEKGLFEQVARARSTLLSSAGPAQKAEASALLTESVPRLVALAEAYPALRAGDNFLALQKRLSALEDLLADRRETYNDTVAAYNTRIQEFPEVMLATRLRLTPREYFRAEGADRVVPSVAQA